MAPSAGKMTSRRPVAEALRWAQNLTPPLHLQWIRASVSYPEQILLQVKRLHATTAMLDCLQLDLAGLNSTGRDRRIHGFPFYTLR